MVIPYCRADCLRVTHPFAARLGIATVLARLACIKHATSVRSEPGSNSSYVFKYCPSTLQNSKLTFEPSLKHISRFFKQRTLARRIPSVNRIPTFRFRFSSSLPSFEVRPIVDFLDHDSKPSGQKKLVFVKIQGYQRVRQKKINQLSTDVECFC